MRSRAFRLVVLFSLLVLAVVLPSVLSGGAKKNRPAVNRAAVAYAPGPEEAESLNSLEGYMAARMTYPTGHFDQRWLLKAAKQDKLVRSGVPAGARPFYKPGTDKAGAKLALDPDAFTSLGPQPQVSTGCQAPCFTFGAVSGRVNSITIQSQGYTPGAGVAYLGTDGGGIWKTTNCCTSSTTWTVTTDGPMISTTSISDVAIDPANPNIVYGATGDLSFGSFSFGSAGVLKSTNAGTSWQVLGANTFAPVYPTPSGQTPQEYPQYQAVSKVRVDPNNSQNVIVGTKTGAFFSYDGGANWTGPCLTTGFTSQRQDISDLILVDANGAAPGGTTDVYAAVGARGYSTYVQFNLGKNGANGIYKTTVPASGCPASWTLLTTQASGWPQGTGSGIACDPPIGDTTTVCSAAANKLGRIEMAVAPSTTNDATPSVVTIYAEVQAIDPHPLCGALQILGETTSRGCFLGLWRTTNSGSSWTQQSNHTKMDPLTSPAAGPCGEDTPQMWYDMGLAVDPTNPDVLFMDAIDIWKSNDGGVTLTDISCGYHLGLNPVGAPVHVDNHALTYAPPVGGVAATLMAGNDGGVYVSQNANVPPPPVVPVPGTNGPTFTQLNATLSTIEFYSGDISANFATDTDPFIVAGAQDNGSSFFQFTSGPGCPPAGCQWSQRIGGDGMFARIEPKQGQRVFMESQVGNLQRSTTGPAGPYTGVSQPWSGDAPRVSFVFPYEIDKFACPTATCDHMIGGSYRVWESIDGGTSWVPNSPDLTKNTLGDRSFINQLSYGYLSNGRAIAGTNDGNVQWGHGLGTGTADDATWINLTGGNTILPNRPINDVVLSPANNLVGYAGVGGFNENTPSTHGHVFEVTCTALCGSFTWLNKTGNLPNIPVNSIVANPNVPKQVFAGTDWGLYYTDNISVASPTWFHFQNGLPNTMIWDMAIDRGATTLAVFTRARGAFAWPLPSLSGTVATLFFDDLEPDPVPGWTNGGACDLWHEISDNDTPLSSHSPTTAWTTNPYADNCDSVLDTPSIVIPGNASSLKLRFWEHHETEYDVACGGPGAICDYGFVSQSIDGGTFTPISGHFEGGTHADPYTQVTIPLSNSLAGHTVKIRFTFHSDTTVSSPVHQGWWVDDIEVLGELGPTAVKVASFKAKTTRRGVALAWRTASEANVLGFNVWRAAKGKSVKVNRTLVAAKGRTRGATYSLVDRRARPGVAYTYRLQLVGKDGRRSWAARAAMRVQR